jgi:hypothetical protein
LNRHFNREVIGFGRAHMAENVPDIFLHFLHPWRSDVLAAVRRSIYT